MNPFTTDEYARRLAAARSALERNGLDALLVFAQESHYYLFGYDGGGYVFFQRAVLTTVEQPVTLICRRPDVAQARDTSSIDDIRVWEDAQGANPARELKAILAEKGLEGQRIGVELDNYGLTGANHQRVREAMAGFCELIDASHVVRTLRLVKSPAEVELVRRAAGLADEAIDAVTAAVEPGVPDSALTAAALTAMLLGGGDAPPMIYAGYPLELEPGMVFFPHLMLGDVRRRIAVGLGNTVLVTAHGGESLTRHDLEPLVCT